MSNRTDTLVIGIGNEYRGDDLVGLYVARALSQHAPKNCLIKESPGEGVQLMNSWEGFEKVIIIDAVRTASAPGTIHRIDALKQNLPDHWVHHSAHTVSLFEAIKLARTLNILPTSLTIYGIEGICFDPGAKISDTVRRAAEKLILTLLAELKPTTGDCSTQR